jgi:hypothetical protein
MVTGEPMLGPKLALKPFAPDGVRNVPTLRFLPDPTATGMDGPLGAPTVMSRLAPADGGNVMPISFVVLKLKNPVALKPTVTGTCVKGMLNDSCPCCWQ